RAAPPWRRPYGPDLRLRRACTYLAFICASVSTRYVPCQRTLVFVPRIGMVASAPRKSRDVTEGENENMSAARAKGTVGAVGLGIMGGAIAKNLAAAGWRVVGYDIDAARIADAKAAGVETVANTAAVAATAPTIITSLPTPAA